MSRLVLIFLLFAISSAGQTVPAVVDTLVVSSSAAAKLNVSVIEIDHSSSNSIADILDTVAGLQIRRYGAHSELSIRGASAGQLLIAVDGLPIGNAQYGTADIDNLPLNRFQKIEVYKGNSPSRFGGRGAGGVVNFISKDASNSGAALQVQAGSFGSIGTSATLLTTNSLVSIYRNSADNNFEYLDHNQTFANSEDDTLRTRANAQSEEFGGYFNISSEDYLLTAGINNRQSGRPGPIGGHQSPNAIFENLSADARMQFNLCSGWKVDLIGRTITEKLHDQEAEVGWDPPGTTTSKTIDKICKFSSENYGLEFRGQTFNQEHAGLVDPTRTRKSTGAFATQDYSYKKLSIKPTLRWQKIRDEFPPVSPIPQIPPGPTVPRVESDFAPTLELRYEDFEAHISSLKRQPNWVELFGHRGGVTGNQALLPEKIFTADIGLKKGNHHVALFATKTDDTIVFLQNSQFSSMARNIGGSETVGAELSSRGRFKKLKWSGNLTFQSAKDKGDNPVYYDKELPMLPSVQGAFNLAVPLSGWRLFSTVEYESASYRNRYNSDNELAPERILLHAQLKKTWSNNYDWTVAFEAKNLTNNSVYDVEGFPLPGRAFAISLTVN